uniref:Uncharacterized protein n=1 Tax=Vitis vinifera TaxID=29760 RepID=F6HE39_VITVI
MPKLRITWRRSHMSRL